MARDMRFDRGWGPKNKKRKSNRKTLKETTRKIKGRKHKNANPSKKEESDEDFFDYIDPEDGFEKFENRR